MKKLLLLFILVFDTQVKAQTNAYHPFPTGNAEWFRHYIPQGCPGPCPYYRVQQNGDTIINTTPYKKIYEQQGTFYPSCGNGIICFNPSGAFTYIGALRQDSTVKKVYYFPSGQPNEFLLYDFNLTLGSVVSATTINSMPDTVKKIDSVLIDGTYHKAFLFFDNTFTNNRSFLIEGVGNSSGPFQDISIQFEYYWGLDCFNQNGIPPNSYNGNGCPEAIAGINKISETNQLNIYPNPTQNSFTIETNYPNKQTVALFDINGKQVLSQTINGKTIIDVNNLSVGVYNISILNNQSVLNKKLIIVK